MKYIRTKEYGVCKVINEDKYTISYENKDVVGCMDKNAYTMRQADTIEELCDEFVVIYESGCHALFDTLGEAETQLYAEIYGAIWTDKGLIYVAKMNSKGELELL